MPATTKFLHECWAWVVTPDESDKGRASDFLIDAGSGSQVPVRFGVKDRTGLEPRGLRRLKEEGWTYVMSISHTTGILLDTVPWPSSSLWGRPCYPNFIVIQENKGIK
jgi:hypothetical protein